MGKTVDGTPRERISLLHHATDIDGSGFIEPHELKLVIHTLMKIKIAAEGKVSFFEWRDVAYADIPTEWIVHLQANELVEAIFGNALRKGKQQLLGAKEFEAWYTKG